MKLTYCPKCHAEMIEDVWEEISELSDGSLQQEILVPAWVCSDSCGYYERFIH